MSVLGNKAERERCAETESLSALAHAFQIAGADSD